MDMTFKLADNIPSKKAKIMVVGVGGGGGNAINTMVEGGLRGVEFIVANTDMQALENSRADIRIQLGPGVTKGLGAGANPERGRESAEESVEELRECLRGSDMVFITAGLGGGTGTGAAPVIARISRELGALTVAVVTRPFLFEGGARKRNAERGWELLRAHVDSIITIPNDRLISSSQKGAKFIDCMKMADNVLLQAVKGITDLINIPGYINPDFADLRTIMSETGMALMGAGQASGENRASAAIQLAIESPLLEDIKIDGAKGVLVNISARQDSLTMAEVTEATTKLYEEVHEDANIILGVIFDESLGEAMRVTVIVTGIRNTAEESLPENVKPLPITRMEKRMAPAPPAFEDKDDMAQEQQGTMARNVTRMPPRGNKGIVPFFDEEKYEIPTFIRKNES